MKFFKLFSLLILTATSLCGCNDNKATLLGNANFLINNEIKDENVFLEGTLSNFENLLSTGLNFVVFFSKDGCPPCDRFRPIITEYTKSSHALVINVDLNNNKDVTDKYGEMFFKKDSEGIVETEAPTLTIVEENRQIYRVDNAQYMQTNNVFIRHMNSKYKINNFHYFDGEITAKSWINKEFTYLQFNNNEVYKNNVLPILKLSSKTIVISKTNNLMYIRIIGRNEHGEFYSKNESAINEKTSEEILKNFL